jgi:hypothetical protein
MVTRRRFRRASGAFPLLVNRGEASRPKLNTKQQIKTPAIHLIPSISTRPRSFFNGLYLRASLSKPGFFQPGRKSRIRA